MKQLCVLLVTTILSISIATAAPIWRTLDYAPTPADNPLKGLVPYAGTANPDNFPHSMEFNYFPLSAVVTGPEHYDWRILDRFLDAVAARGHQAIFRFYAEYPGKKNSLPEFLFSDGGLKLLRSERKSTPPRPPVEIETPDYKNAALRQMLTQFVKALGARYDGDPRIGFITAGLLGHWGEWHNSPLDDQFADKDLQTSVMNAYAESFLVTPILLRYPAGENDMRYASNAARAFGYHDDSFAWGTLGKASWHFMTRMQAAGPAALAKWQTQPVGGEIRPEAWGIVFDASPADARIENFRNCVDATHATWLMDSGMFKAGNPAARRERAIEEVRHMGYEFQVSRTALDMQEKLLDVRLEIANRGVAPFYYAWPLELRLLDTKGKIMRTQRIETGSLKDIQPGATALRTQTIDLADLRTGQYRVLLRAANPLPQGLPLRFANATRDQDAAGWLTLGSFALP